MFLTSDVINVPVRKQKKTRFVSILMTGLYRIVCYIKNDTMNAHTLRYMTYLMILTCRLHSKESALYVPVCDHISLQTTLRQCFSQTNNPVF